MPCGHKELILQRMFLITFPALCRLLGKLVCRQVRVFTAWHCVDATEEEEFDRGIVPLWTPLVLSGEAGI